MRKLFIANAEYDDPEPKFDVVDIEPGRENISTLYFPPQAAKIDGQPYYVTPVRRKDVHGQVLTQEGIRWKIDEVSILLPSLMKLWVC